MNQDPQARRAVLTAVARTPDLFHPYVLKGGLALHYAYGSPRQSHDLDFNAVGPFPTAATAEGERRVLAFCHTLERELKDVAAAFG
ncbi:MAG: nucleotidyl transferase AbiEii/AbiGii toxin family protein, partial [Rhodothermales bacterium]|nr:nucleotidyl transferase AbiEii/AbiGii toxin family protein [Rhodothermales bacterium]